MPLLNLTATGLRRAAALAALLLLSACSSLKPWINEPLTGDGPPAMRLDAQRDPSLLMAVTLSGGGARAAAFGYGVLSELRDTPIVWEGQAQSLLDATDVISGVSGGSIVAAYYAAYGAEGLASFEHNFLRVDFQRSLIDMALLPANMIELSSPWFGRTHLLARRLESLYGGMTFGDLEKRPRHPQLIVTATDLSRGGGFEFTWDQFTQICSDLRSVPLSFAVAASSAVPLLLSPVTLNNYAAQCPPRALAAPLAEAQALAEMDPYTSYRARMFRAHARSYKDADKRPFIHLVDGGLSDNLGVQRLLDRTLADGGLRASLQELGLAPGVVRKLVLIVVNSERDPEEDIDHQDTVPTTWQVVDQLLFGAGARATLETQEFLKDVTRQWRSELARAGHGGRDAFAPDAEIHVIQVNLRDVPDHGLRRQLLRVPTAFTIGPGDVSELTAAGRQVLRQSPDYQALLRSLGAQQPAPPQR